MRGMKAVRALWLAVALGLGAGSAQAQVGSPISMEKNEGPIEINADTLDVRQDKKTATFTGNVIATQGKLSLKSQQMIVFYRDKQEAASGMQRISKIDVDGDVFLSTGAETAKGKKGTYYVDQKVVRLFGDVLLTQGQNVLRGDALEYNMATGQSKIVGGAAAGGVPGVTRQGGRVKGLFMPDSAPK